MQTREQTLNSWLSSFFPRDFTLLPLTGDASFRRYFRLRLPEQSYIVMDAPPEKENLSSFLAIQSWLTQADIQVPRCIQQNVELGFLVLTDFGDALLLQQLKQGEASTLYHQALDLLGTLQKKTLSLQLPLPRFDAAHIKQELSYFTTWFLQAYLKLDLSSAEQSLLDTTFDQLTQHLLRQPQVFIHRDFHSRNIMYLPDRTLGLIDFQDAMLGPMGYDLVSLLKDCYIQWPRTDVIRYISYFHQHHLTHIERDLPTLISDVDICGLQRHLKVLGIFARLALRDQKMSYLQDLPLTLQYVQEFTKETPVFHDFADFISTRIRLP